MDGGTGPLRHVPVMAEEVLNFSKKEGLFLDATAGTGGHMLTLLENTQAKVVGLDIDLSSLRIAARNLRGFEGRFMLVNGDMKTVKNLFKTKFDLILFDFGLSSFQLEDEKRGFSFRKEGPLDMRFGRKGITAREFLENVSVEELAKILRKYGDLPNAKVIARDIKKKLPKTTLELALVVRKRSPRRKGHKFVARVFQAIRMAINEEEENVKLGIEGGIELLKKDGRLIFITYHSGEEKRALEVIKERNDVKLLTKKPVRPGKEEIKRNPRARSAHLRVLEKL